MATPTYASLPDGLSNRSVALAHYAGMVRQLSPRQQEIAEHIALLKHLRQATCALRSDAAAYSLKLSGEYLAPLGAIDSALSALLLERELWSPS